MNLNKEKLIATKNIIILGAISLICMLASKYIINEKNKELEKAWAIHTQEKMNEIKIKKEIEVDEESLEIIKQAKAEGLDPKEWNEIKTNIKRQTIKKEAANKITKQITRTKNSYFGATKFDISVLLPEDSLFNKGNISNELMVDIQGTSILSKNEKIN